MSWRNDPVTEKQMQLIQDIQEFSEYHPPAFKGKTKGEASDYINAHIKLAHERILPYDDNYGDII